MILFQKNFATLTQITHLDLSNNNLKELPENFGNLKQLKHLDLYNNQIKHLPLSFAQLKSLKWLDLKNNQLVPALAQVAGPCIEAKQCQQSAKKVVDFLAKMQDKVNAEINDREAQKKAAEPPAAVKPKEDPKKKQNKKEKVVEKSKEKNTKTVKNQVEKTTAVKVKKAKPGKKQQKSSCLGLLFKLIFRLFLLVALVTIGCYVHFTYLQFNETYKLGAAKVGELVQVGIGKLPPVAQEYIEIGLGYVRPFNAIVYVHCVKGVEFLLNIPNTEQYKLLREQVQKYLVIVLEKGKQIYNDNFNKTKV